MPIVFQKLKIGNGICNIKPFKADAGKLSVIQVINRWCAVVCKSIYMLTCTETRVDRD